MTPTDGVPTNDPTPVFITPVGSVVLVKSVGSITDVNGDGVTAAGDIVNYTFAVTNTGTVTLTDVTVSDRRSRWCRVVRSRWRRGATDVLTFTATYTIDPTRCGFWWCREHGDRDGQHTWWCVGDRCV